LCTSQFEILGKDEEVLLKPVRKEKNEEVPCGFMWRSLVTCPSDKSNEPPDSINSGEPNGISLKRKVVRGFIAYTSVTVEV
jgi:hypothetical protein